MNTDHLLFGTDDTEGIVGIATHGDKHVRLWIRDSAGNVTDKIDRVYPFIYTTEFGLKLIGDAIGPNNFKKQDAKGPNELNKIAVFDTVDMFRKARRALYADPVGMDHFFTYGDPTVAYLVQTGKTMFKGLSPDLVHRMQVDIESFRLDGFPNAEHDPIFIISITDNRGFRKVLFQTETPDVGLGAKAPAFAKNLGTEEEMLRELVKIINRVDPDIIEGHNIFGFDLPYIQQRALINNVNFAIGRDSKVPYQYAAEKKFAERDIKYTNFVVGGRSVIDTMFLALDWDVYARTLTDYSLKGIAKTLEVSPENRTYIDGDKIAQTWLDNPLKVLEYALDDTLETLGISTRLGSSAFALTQMLPMPFQKVHLAGKASVIQSMFVREYLRLRESLPTSKPGTQQWGGYTDIFKTGVYDDIWYVDVASLYPSIMLNYDIKPAQDHLGIFQIILQGLTDLRFQTKGAMKKAKDPSRKEMLSAREQAFKIIINSFYGMLGAGGIALFATISEADRVARTGQGLLRRMMELIVAEGSEIIECDTDGVLCTTPPDRNFATDGPEFCDLITSRLPKGIVADFDGAYTKMISMAKKNYALMKPDGTIKVKGGSFKSRSLEPLLKQYIDEQIKHLFNRDSKQMRETHIAYQRMIMSPIDPQLLSRTVTIKETMKTYDENVASGGNRAPQYEIAKWLKAVHNRRAEKGDRISYVVTGNKPISKVVSYLDATALEFVRPGTHHVKHYLKKLDNVAQKRFGTFFADEDIYKVFPKDPPSNTIDMFGGVVFHGTNVKNDTVGTPSFYTTI